MSPSWRFLMDDKPTHTFIVEVLRTHYQVYPS